MTRDEKFRVKRRSARRDLWRQFSSIPALPLKIALLSAYIAGAVYVQGKQEAVDAFMETLILPAPLVEAICDNLLRSYLLAGVIAFVVLLVYPFNRKMVTDGCLQIALTNNAGETPTLLRVRRDKEHPRVKIWELNNPSIPLKMWEDKQLAIEAAFDINVVSVDFGKSTSRIILKFVPGRNVLPKHIVWEDEYLSPDSFVLTLGEGYIGPVTVDLASIPHILLGGSTGSGKSVLLKLLLMQSLHKGAEVYIADFKGGVDFPPAWHERCRMCFEEDDLLELLTGLADELERRKKLFGKVGCSNLDEYNKVSKTQLKRLVFACDEVAEILDKSGADKKRKDQIGLLESKLSIIARQGRAFGIHLILATQRPDANLIPGQIRTNLGCRICGRADSILSQIILDSTAAADQISKEARGRFLLHDGTMFQSFLFDETTTLGAGGNSIQA
ncbi:MAG: hypothetical protein J6A62_07925 [Oscillospiraceae bacterium]|nr:hypothetical protein [Oscillospiraceae bacterium]